jgi:hypothetical protein
MMKHCKPHKKNQMNCIKTSKITSQNCKLWEVLNVNLVILQMFMI